MKSDIRKISVGLGYPDKAIHYQVGTTVRLQGVPYKIALIQQAKEEKYTLKVAHHIYIEKVGDEAGGFLYWKTVVDLPVMIENNINFE